MTKRPDRRFLVAIEGQRAAGPHGQLGDLVALHLAGGLACNEVAGLQDAMDGFHPAASLVGRQPQDVLPVHNQRLGPQPEDVAAEGAGDGWQSAFMARYFAALDKYLLVQGDANGLARKSLHRGWLDVEGLDGLHHGVLT